MAVPLSAQAWRDAQNGLNARIRRVSGGQGALRVHYWGAAPGLLSNRPHKHSFFEVCYCASGTGTYHEDGREWPIRAGTMFCSRPGVPHQITVEPEGKLYLLFVAFETESDMEKQEAGEGAYRTLSPHDANAGAGAAAPMPGHGGNGKLETAALTEAYERLAAAGRLLWVDDAANTAAAHLWEALLREAAATAQGEPLALDAIAYALTASFPQLFAPELQQRGGGEARCAADARPRRAGQAAHARQFGRAVAPCPRRRLFACVGAPFVQTLSGAARRAGR
ncbi:cupin domain-containing protein [Gordoniibacillus kamchatkensis]|uniref:cupin domain-containing protein n=1 Tax=Gordoniibacillus kamchatkensis TaxID=1590651 RepID=UPI0006972F61|nr:AraC family ligand binding domain-containing protein [Paenibacillus sp. VKM B-2647]